MAITVRHKLRLIGRRLLHKLRPTALQLSARQQLKLKSSNSWKWSVSKLPR